MSGIVHRPTVEHACQPPSAAPGGLPLTNRDHPAGTVWQCDCDRTWVSQGMTGGGQQHSGGYSSASLRWRAEGRRERRTRERHSTPEQVPGDERKPLWNGVVAVGPPIEPDSSLSAEVAVPIVPTFHNRDITDRLKAAERCVLDLTEALTGDRHDGIYDYDQARDRLLVEIRLLQQAGAQRKQAE